MPINANKQIEEAMERGEFADLPGKGKPLKLDTNPYLTPPGTHGQPTPERERIRATLG